MPNFLYSLKCLALTLWRCQCMPVSSGPNTCIRYIPTFLIFVKGSFVWMMGRVTKGPPSLGQQVIMGSFVISGLSMITCWQSPLPLTDLGIQLANWLNRGNSFNLSIRFSFGEASNLNIPSISEATWSSSFTPKAMHIRFSLP